MGDKFQGRVCGGNWWNSSRNLFSSSSCSADLPWLKPSLIVDMKTTKSLSDDSDGGSSVVLQKAQKPQLTANRNMSIDSTLDDWNQANLFHDNARSQENYSHIRQALNSSMNCHENIADEEWTPFEFSADSPTKSFEQVRQSFLLEQHQSNLDSPLNTASYGYASSSLQTLFDTDLQPRQALLDSPNLGMNSTGLALSKASSMMTPSFPTQHSAANYFQFINAPFCNATSQRIPSALTKARINKPHFSAKHHNQRTGDAESAVKKDGNEPSLKRPKIETPSPLPSFKVRKEKLGDRVTALQQLVSPFGKTDTASVLHEAIEYIKLLHDQVTVLSTPYLKNGQPPMQRQQGLDNINNQEEQMKDLRSRGLCLVPISSTFPVANGITADFWTPTFRGSFR